MLDVFKKTTYIAFLLGIAGSFPSLAVTPEEVAGKLGRILENYQAEHPGDLVSFTVHQDPPRVESLWRNAREVVRFYHGSPHAQLKALFGLSPLPAHGAEEIKQLRGRLDSGARVQVTNLLEAPIRNIIRVLDEDLDRGGPAGEALL